jgi:hypothetical protein
MAAPDIEFTTEPESPDGSDEWFVTGPDILLIPEYTADVYWRWGTSGAWNSSGSIPETSGAEISAPLGDNTLYFFASGAASGSGPINAARFLYDDIDPSGGFLHPTSGEYLSGEIILQASGTDTYAGIDEFVFRVDGKTIASIQYPIDLYYWDTTAEVDGLKYLGLEIADAAGNTYDEEIFVYVDNLPPTQTINPYMSPLVWTSGALTGTASDSWCNIDKVQYWIFASGGSIPTWQDAIITSGSGTPDVVWSVPLSGLVNGETYTVKIRSWDIAGNVQNSANYITVSFPVRYI